MSANPGVYGEPKAPAGRFVTRGDRRYYEIEHVDEMPPFFMTVVGESDLWLYVSSSGGVTGGRVEPERCLFPYETDDRLHAAAGVTGPVTMIRFEGGSVWHPMDPRPLASGRTRRLLRTPVGDALMFEETDHATGLTFRAEWSLADTHGIVRRCELELDAGASPVRVEVLDGFLNLMPANVPLGTQQAASTLVDAYKRSELDEATTLAVYSLEAAISDRPEACESLRANAVWRAGLPDAVVSLSEEAVRDFARGRPASACHLNTGSRGAYLCRGTIECRPGGVERWAIVGDVHLDHRQLIWRRRWLRSEVDRFAALARDLDEGRERLAALLDAADGSQLTRDESVCAAHRSNVLFNAMRGGVPPAGDRVDVGDFRRFVHSRHVHIAGRHDGMIARLGADVTLGELHAAAEGSGDPQFVRLALEYLPLTFGRRHGDPSRPWNRFRVRMRHADGSRALGYEGNWRDIFQNWEAACRSYPALLPGVIAKFVNASTPDGHNPYRISEAGIDWEVPDPDDPWANIGYWGDHQVVYLLRLLEQWRDTDPGTLERMLTRAIFSYADVPYHIRPFDALVRNPKGSIRFDREHDQRVRERAGEVGADGRLVPDENGEPCLVTLLEKLLVTALAKVANFVPGGGIWMNTQRPEWNDANNALAGFGLSMVTLYHLRRFSDFVLSLLGQIDADEVPVSDAIAKWCDDTREALGTWAPAMAHPGDIDDTARWRVIESLGRAASHARERIGERGLGRATKYSMHRITAFLQLTREACDHSIRRALRSDGLYESYNVLVLDESRERASVDRLQAMLEGQVAVLSAGVLGAEASLGVLDALFASELYREDQRTFMLYPRTNRPSFFERNVIPESAVAASELLQRVLEERVHRVAYRDEDGRARFHADLVGRGRLEARLTELGEDPAWADLVRADSDGVRAAYEGVFQHGRFTGRSGTMHKYEGIGSVYWHMVSKLLLAAQECVLEAADRAEPAERVAKLVGAYRRVRDGLGMHKSPGIFGAVPHEPYSHTPWHAGAQQPGMTGQVKEGILARFGELGVRLHAGELRFDPVLLDPDEFLREPAVWRLHGQVSAAIELPAGSLGFSVCGTPIVLGHGQDAHVLVVLDDGSHVMLEGTSLGKTWTGELLTRSGRIARLEVELPVGVMASRTPTPAGVPNQASD